MSRLRKGWLFFGICMVGFGLFFVDGSLIKAQTADFTVDAGQVVQTYKKFWGSFGYAQFRDQTTFDYGIDFYDSVRNANQEIPGSFTWSRSHNMFSDATYDGNPVVCDRYRHDNPDEECLSYHGVYHEDDDGNVSYDFIALDEIYDVILDSGMKPIVDLSLMPRQLIREDICRCYSSEQSGCEDYDEESCGDNEWLYNYDCWISRTSESKLCLGCWGWGHISPPNNIDRWRDLVYETVVHLQDRYGSEEIESWWWEVWNEPEHRQFWPDTLTGNPCGDLTMEELYDYTLDALRQANPNLKIGGLSHVVPDTNRRRCWLEHLLTEANWIPVGDIWYGNQGDIREPDFISFHSYDDNPHAIISLLEEHV